MITIENDCEPIINEQPFNLHIYENQSELLQDYYTRPISINVPVTKKVNEVSTVIRPEKDEVQCSSTNHIYPNIQKEKTREKIWLIPILLESRKGKEIQPPDLEIDLLILSVSPL